MRTLIAPIIIGILAAILAVAIFLRAFTLDIPVL